MHFNFLSLFPDFIDNFFNHGVIYQAQKKSLITYKTINPRLFTWDDHQSVDDRPYGGGDGMVMMAEPLSLALASLTKENKKGRVIYLSPQGTPWTDQQARQWAQDDCDCFTFVCGRYSGVDQRFIEKHVDIEISLGDFVMSGGELAALAVADSVARHLKGVLGHGQSADQDTFKDGLLECPQFTRPADFEGLEVPKVFLSGHHQKIQDLKEAVALVRTCIRRPELLKDSPKAERLQQAVEELNGLNEAELKVLGVPSRWKSLVEKNL